MIKINKAVEPNILAKNKSKWTERLLEYISKEQKIPDSLSSKYNDEEVKESLKVECRNKCMYCESNISHVAHEHIEHVKPKAKDKYPELTFEWTNLGLACPICNMNKRDIYDPELPFINPYEEDPVASLFACGPLLYNWPGKPRGELTIRILELNRTELFEKRKERIELIIGLIERYHSQENTTLKRAILEQIKIEIGVDKPYSLCASSIYNALFVGYDSNVE